MEIVENIRRLPELCADSIHIWGIHVPDMMDQLDALGSVLSDAERAKALRYGREADRNASIVARGALRVLLSGYTASSADRIEFNYTENGKPHIAGSEVAFNVSHSMDWIVLACGQDRAIGVDIEQIKRDMDVQSIAARYYAPDECEVIRLAEDPHGMFFQLWARKEALIKACGSTLFTELKRTSVPIENGAERNGWFFYHLEAGSEYAAAVVTDKPLGSMPCYDFGGLKWQN